MQKFCFAVISLMLAGCANTSIIDLQPDELSAVDTAALCNAYVNNQRPEKLRAEIERREVITQEEWPVVDDGNIVLGMGIPALFCSFGLPRQFYTRPDVGLSQRDSGAYMDTGTGRTLLVSELDLDSGFYRIRYPSSRHSKRESIQVTTKRGKVSSWSRRYFRTRVPSQTGRRITLF